MQLIDRVYLDGRWCCFVDGWISVGDTPDPSAGELRLLQDIRRGRAVSTTCPEAALRASAYDEAVRRAKQILAADPDDELASDAMLRALAGAERWDDVIERAEARDWLPRDVHADLARAYSEKEMWAAAFVTAALAWEKGARRGIRDVMRAVKANCDDVVVPDFYFAPAKGSLGVTRFPARIGPLKVMLPLYRKRYWRRGFGSWEGAVGPG